MGGYYCESVFRTLLDFPVDLNEGDEFILCGLSNLAPPQENQTPASKIRIDDAYLQVQEKYDDKGELIIYKRETAARFKVWPIVVDKPGPGSTNDGSLIAGTYLMVYGVCGAQTPEKLTIKYSWTHEGTEYCVSEDIHNYPRAKRPDTRLAELEFSKPCYSPVLVLAK
ncbi:hypothetical protein F4825DRAFT_424492 [Nemania diffusa]|nr:hypothetical protein F4825DRAFT_424492 [Nemania diffusa]